MTVKSLVSDILNRVFNSVNDSFDVSIQDQTTPLLSRYMSQKIKTDILLTADGVAGEFTIDVSAGHGFTGGGEWCEIIEGDYYYQAEVVSVSTNEITLALPLPYTFTVTGAQVFRVSVNMNVNGSVTPIEFSLTVPASIDYDTYGSVVTIADASPMDGGTFGGITALTNGLYFGVTSTARNGYLFNMKRNQDLVELACQHQYDDKAPSGEYLFKAQKFWAGGMGGNGVAVRLYGSLNSKLIAVVRDDTSANTRMRVAIMGHTVD